MSERRLHPQEVQRLEQLLAAGGLDHQALSDRARAILGWLAGWGPDTVAAVCELLAEAHARPLPPGGSWDVSLILHEGPARLTAAEGVMPLFAEALVSGEAWLRLTSTIGTPPPMSLQFTEHRG